MSPPLLPGAVGDGLHDDTAGLQAALDSGASVIHLPTPPACYLITQPLRIHSGQTLDVERNAMVRLADHAHAHMLTNAGDGSPDRGITVRGGIWDGNNAHQTCEYHQTRNWRVPYDPARYLGVLMQFDRVEDLRIGGLTLKDPETFGIQIANIRRFTVEGITFDYNMLRANMDGVHLHGNCHQGRIANLKGATNDDMVAVNADDGWMYEMARGPITDIQIDGLWAENGYTGVRLLSAGSPISRVRISNIFGNFRYFVVSFTHHNVHPEDQGEISDVVIDGVFCSKPLTPLEGAFSPDPSAPHRNPLFWVESGSLVRSLLVSNLLRTEALEDAPPCFHVSPNARVEHLGVSGASMVNLAQTPLDFLHNEGIIESLNLSNIHCRAEGGEPRGRLVRNEGTIGERCMANVMPHNLEPQGEDL